MSAISRTGLRHLLDHDFVDVSAVNLRLPLRLPDDAKALSQIGLQAGFVIGPHICEEFLVTLPARGVERRREEQRRNPLPSQLEIDVGADDAHVIERMRETPERRHVLESDDAIQCGIDGNEKGAVRRKGANEFALHLDGKRDIHRGIAARRDDRIEDRQNLFGVLNPHIAYLDHAFLQEIRRIGVFFEKNSPDLLISCSRSTYFASGSGRSWNCITLLVVPLPVSMWNGARVLMVAHRPLPFQPFAGSSMRPSIHFV